MALNKKQIRIRKRVRRFSAGMAGMLVGTLMAPGTVLAAPQDQDCLAGASTTVSATDTTLTCGTETWPFEDVADVLITGTAGNDKVIFDLATDVTNGGKVQFVVDLVGTGDVDEIAITGTDGNDALAFGTNGINLNDSLGPDVFGTSTTSKVASMNVEKVSATGGQGSDNFNAGGGRLNGDPFTLPITFSGGPGADFLYGGTENDVLDGDGGHDLMFGGKGDDTLNGGGGNDRFGEASAPNGADTFNGGSGARDAVDYSDRSSAIAVTLDEMANDGARDADGDLAADDPEGDNVKGDVERVWATTGDDTLDASGGDGKYFLYGRAGDDTLTGSPQNDKLFGGTGNDHMAGGAGNDLFKQETASDGADVMDGQDGVDKVSYRTRRAAVNVTVTTGGTPTPGSTGNDGDIAGSGEGDYVVNVEKVDAGRGDDRLEAANLKSRLYGGSGNDELHGGSADDRLIAGSGNDKLDGNAGDDYGNGGSGTDQCRELERKRYCEGTW